MISTLSQVWSLYFSGCHCFYLLYLFYVYCFVPNWAVGIFDMPAIKVEDYEDWVLVWTIGTKLWVSECRRPGWFIPCMKIPYILQSFICQLSLILFSWCMDCLKKTMYFWHNYFSPTKSNGKTIISKWDPCQTWFPYPQQYFCDQLLRLCFQVSISYTIVSRSALFGVQKIYMSVWQVLSDLEFIFSLLGQC